MVTDDPGTVSPGHWEINIASINAMSAEGSLFQAPYVDVNYGANSRIQIKLETGWIFFRNSSSKSESGDGPLVTGFKFRFLDEESSGIAVSTYPQFQFHPSFASKNPDLTPPGNSMILPLEFLKSWGDWELNPDIGYVYANQSSDELFYGFVVGYEGLKPFEPLFELHANTHLDHSGTAMLVNFGMRYTLSSHLNPIFAIGHTVTHYADQPTELDSYVGVQLEL